MNIILTIPPSPDKKNIIRMIDCSHEAKANYLWQPNDLMIITSLLKPSDGVVFIDGTAEHLSSEEYFEAFDKAQGDLIIFALSSVCWESDYSFYKMTRDRFPEHPFFVLGDIFLDERYQRLILDECDGIIFNPYLLDLRAMLNAETRAGGALLPGVLTVRGQRMFEEEKKAIAIDSKTPRHELFLKRGYRFPFARHKRFTTVTTVWGCPFHCTYCSDSHFPPVIRSCQDVINEIDYISSLGIKELFFADKVFGFSRQNILPLLEKMALCYGFSWSCYFHPQLYDPALLGLMARAGCHTIIIGIDSADTAALSRYQRRIDKEKIEQIIEHAGRLNIDICADFILGLPHENEEDICRTIQYALDAPIDFASFNIAAPLPGSDIRQRMTTEGKLLFGKEGFDTCGCSGVLGNENISSGQLRELRTVAFRQFYLRPSYLLRRLKKTRSLEHLMIQLEEMLSMAGKV